ncbi:hypothetical protein ACFV3E_29185 [Streptomyces sp. NPDC059718]
MNPLYTGCAGDHAPSRLAVSAHMQALRGGVDRIAERAEPVIDRALWAR